MDALYKYIMRTLQTNGRTEMTTIANTVGITPQAVKKRFDNLSARYIKRISAIPVLPMWGYYIESYCMITLNNQSNETFDEFIQYMENIKEIRNVDLVNGSIDFIVKIIAKDQYHMNDIIGIIRESPHLLKIQFFNILENRVDKPGIPV